MKTLYTIIILITLSTSSSFAQLEGILGDVLQEVQEKVGDAQQKSENDAADTASMMKFKEEIKNILSGINGLDKYSSELKCIYVILKLAGLYESLEAGIQNAELCKEKYDLYGMQLMVNASTTGIGYCFDSLTDLLLQNDHENRTPEFIQLLDEYEEVSKLAICFISYHPNCDNGLEGASKLELDFIKTVGLAVATYDNFSQDLEGSYEYRIAVLRRYIHSLLGYLIGQYNPVQALGKSIYIGKEMKALPCSDGRS